MGYKTIQANNRGPSIVGSNVSGKHEKYHTYEDGELITFISVTVNSFDTSGANPSISNYLMSVGDKITLSTAGYYNISFSTPADIQTSNIQMYAWGGGGGIGGAPGPGGGAAGGGVTGAYSISDGSNLTAIVGGAGSNGGPGSGARPGGFPDGGTGTNNGAGGGGRTSIGSGIIPFSSRDSPTTSYLLIGGGGGGGSLYLTSGIVSGQGGYPAGSPGGAYYPADGSVFGGGGTQSSGGTAGPAGRQPAGFAGSKYAGGPGGTGDGGGAGGGGWYGGGGAGGYYAHGGGGSSYINPSITTNTSSFNAVSGATHNIAVDPSGYKPATSGNGQNAGCVVIVRLT